MSRWREQRRADKLADAEAQAVLLRARAEQTRQDAADHTQRHRQEQQDRRERRQAWRQAWSRRLTALRVWLGRHAPDVLIYQLALVSAVMAVPAMAAWGQQQYGAVTGALLPVITELGMWAFALAVQLHRRRHPNGSVWALQVGVVVFAGVAAMANFLHGLATPGGAPVRGVVMAVVSVAGVTAHQIVTATRPRTRLERQRQRRERRFERAALARAVARIDHAGAVELVIPAGTYRLRRRRRLEPAAVPGLPVHPVDDLDRELAALVQAATTGSPTGTDGPDRSGSTGPVGLLDPPAGTPESAISTAITDPGADQERTRCGRDEPPAEVDPAAESSTGTRPARPLDELRAQLQAAVEADPDSVDPASAESIRRFLRCRATTARHLRDDWRRRH